jgi:Putative zinc-finger
MTDTSCAYTGNRDDILIAYLYDDIDPIARATFDAHLASCGRCRADLADLRGVRAELAQWAPPEPAFASRTSHVASQLPATSHQPLATGRSFWWRDIPAWAQVAAALLFLGVSAGIANLDVRYNADGLTVRTGWSKPAGMAQDVSPVKSATAPAPWRADLTALEQQLRTEFHAASLASAPAPAAPAATLRSAATTAGDADLIRRVRALLDDSERRQQRELSLRLAEALRDVSAQRRADLVRIDQNLGLIQNNTGIEVAKQREMLNYLVRASSQK